MSDLGGIELVFREECWGVESKDTLVDELSVVNLKGGIVTEYDLGKENVRPETFSATIHKKDGPVQTLSFLRGEEAVLATVAAKDLPDFVTYAILNAKRGVLYLKWNRRQKPHKTLVRATFWAGG